MRVGVHRAPLADWRGGPEDLDPRSVALATDAAVREGAGKLRDVLFS